MLRTALGIAAMLVSSTALPADDLKISPDATLRYLQEQYQQSARQPRLGFNLQYSPPYLHISWQTGRADPQTPELQQAQATIDLRYAKFDAWSDGRRDWNIIIIDCNNYYPCYQDDVRHLRFGHGEIDYFLLGYASEPIASALNHLASFYASRRPKSPFD